MRGKRSRGSSTSSAYADRDGGGAYSAKQEVEPAHALLPRSCSGKTTSRGRPWWAGPTGATGKHFFSILFCFVISNICFICFGSN